MITELPAPQCQTGLRTSLESLYEDTFPAVARFVRSMRGDLEDAQDIFQDALVIFYEKRQQNKLDVHGLAEAYILGIAKHLWIRKFNQNQQRVFFSQFEQQIEIPGEEIPSVSANELLLLLQQSGQKCMELLKAFYYDNLSMKKLKHVFGYSTERSATVQKYKCIEKIRNTVKSKKLTYEDLLE